MFRIRKSFLLGVMLACLGCGACQVSQAARVITDDRGVELTLSSPAKRIVSLYPSLTESVCLLNACDRLVGVDRSSNWPEWVQSLPHLGGMWDTSIEDLVRLKPDVVIMSYANLKLTARLEALGISVLIFQPHSVLQMKRTLTSISKMVEPFDGDFQAQDNVQTLIQQIDAELLLIQANMPPWARGRRVYLEVGSDGYAASEGSYIGQLMEQLGVVNVVPKSLGAFPKLGKEWLLKQSPEMIVFAYPRNKSFKNAPGWRVLKAVKDDHLCVLTQEQSDRLLRLGPRVAAGLKAVVECFQKMRPL